MEFIDQASKFTAEDLGFLAGSRHEGCPWIGAKPHWDWSALEIRVLWSGSQSGIRPCRYSGTKKCTIFWKTLKHPLSDQHPQCSVWVAAHYLPPHVSIRTGFFSCRPTCRRMITWPRPSPTDCTIPTRLPKLRSISHWALVVAKLIDLWV